MSLVIIDSFPGQVIKIGGVCYTFVGTTTDPTTGETAGDVFASCDDCLYPTPTPTVTPTITPTATPPPSLLIDAVGVSTRSAFGLRKLRSAYAGSAVQVIRTSDNATQNIGFDANNNFDYAAAESFVGAGGTGNVKVWYDQSGNGYDCTPTARWRLVTSGACIAGPKAGTYAVFGNNGYGTFNTAGLAPPFSASFVFKTGTNITDQKYLLSRQSGGSDGTIYLRVYDGKFDYGYRDSVGLVGVLKSVATSTWYVHQALCSGTVGEHAQMNQNGGALANSADHMSAMTARTWNAGLLCRSDYAEGFPFNGNVCEIVVWSAALDATQRAAADSNQNGFYGVY